MEGDDVLETFGDRLPEADGPALQVAPLAGVPAALRRPPVTA